MPINLAPPNVLLITLCSWRVDHTGAYGYAKATTPHFDAFARDAMLFDEAYANATFTDISHASLFTGLLPGHDGILDVGDHIRADIHTLPEVLAAYGYRSVAVLDHASGMAPPVVETMARGFGTILDAPGDALGPSLMRWIEQGNQPWLAWIHLRRAHIPYGPGAPFTDHVEPAVREWIGHQGKPPGPSDTDDRNQRFAAAMAENPAISDSLRAVYDSGLARSDAQLGQVLDALAARDFNRNTTVVIAADHGELLGESGQFGHQGQLAEPVLHVPLLIRAPGGHAGRSDALVSLVDLMPTIEGIVGAKPQATADGANLSPVLSGGTMPVRSVLAQAVRRAGERGSVDLYEALIQPPYWLSSSATASRLWHAELDHWSDVTADEPARLAEMNEARAKRSEGTSFRAIRNVVPPAQKQQMQEQGYW